MRVPVFVEAEATAEKSSGGATIVEELSSKVDAAERQRDLEQEQKRRQAEAERARREQEREVRATERETQRATRKSSARQGEREPAPTA